MGPFCCSLLERKNFPDTVFAEAKATDYTREQLEAALDKAEERSLTVGLW
jgi:hypothetical protein